MIAFSWASVRSSLGSWIESTIGIRATDMHGPQLWGGSIDFAPAINAEARCSIVQGRTIGHDLIKKTYDEDAEIGEEIQITIYGMRELTWEIRVESRSSGPGEDAISYVEMIKALLRDRVAKAAFRSAGIGLHSIGPTINLSTLTRNRMLSVAQVDVLLYGVFQTQGSKYGYIERVFVESDLRQANGVLFPNEFQIIGEIT